MQDSKEFYNPELLTNRFIDRLDEINRTPTLKEINTCENKILLLNYIEILNNRIFKLSLFADKETIANNRYTTALKVCRKKLANCQT